MLDTAVLSVALLLRLPEPKCVPWLEKSTLCMWKDGHYNVELYRDYEEMPPPCEWDTGNAMLPEPCRIQVTPGEWLIVRNPRPPK